MAVAYVPPFGAAHYHRQCETTGRSRRLRSRGFSRRFSTAIMSAHGMRDVLDSGGYRGMILDQFGVVHDGRVPYPNAVSTLNSVRDAGVHIVILSNSSRRADHAMGKLREMGFGELDVITSGELARTMLRGVDNPLRSCVNTVHTNWLNRGAVDLVDSGIKTPWVSMIPEGAERQVDAAVMHGTEGVTTATGQVEPVEWDRLKSFFRSLGGANPDIPVVCVNPDVITVDGGVLRSMPGALAAEFERAGGNSVFRMGKPAKLAYDAALALLAEKGVGPGQVICVGDSIAHDIRGALEATPSLHCVYIAGGIHADDFGLDRDGCQGSKAWTMDWDVWNKIVDRESPGCRPPTYSLPYFRW
jgi:HAD superfamily hydrolase (TIGR01459 family)